VIEVKDLNVSFKTAAGVIKVVENVSFSIGKGECLAVVGESGSGKSVSALATIGLLVKDQSVVTGSVLFRGEELLGKPESYMRKIRGGGISMIFQEPLSALNPVTTIGEQIAEVLVAHGRAGWREANKKAIEYLELVEIAQAPQRVKQYPHQLSGGMRQRAMIAMALAGEPELIIADEPTTALDVTIQAQVLDLLRRATRERETALLLITHDLGVVAETADRVAVMYAGQIIEEGPAAAVIRTPASPYARDLVDSIPSYERRGKGLSTIEGMVPSPANFPKGCRFHPRCRYAVAACSSSVPELELRGASRSVRCFRADEIAAGARPTTKRGRSAR
jgi:peptide/nickel transport system ATP-binding protein/oligopeptide transport system ATP-binding protein